MPIIKRVQSMLAMIKVLIISMGVDCKARDNNGPFPIIQVHTSDKVRIQCDHLTEHINIGRIMPYFE